MATVLPNSNTQGKSTSTTSIPATKKREEDEKTKPVESANPLLTEYNQSKPASTAKTADQRFADTLARLDERKKANDEAYKASPPSENAKIDAMYQRAVDRSSAYNKHGSSGGSSDRADRAALTTRLRQYSDPNSELRTLNRKLEEIQAKGVSNPFGDKKKEEPKKEEPAPATGTPAPATGTPAPVTPTPATGTPATGTPAPTSPLLTAYTDEEKRQKQQAANVTNRALTRAGVSLSK